jgi:hypothetical protein
MEADVALVRVLTSRGVNVKQTHDIFGFGILSSESESSKYLSLWSGYRFAQNGTARNAAPLSGAEEQTARAISAYAQYAYLISL